SGLKGSLGSGSFGLAGSIVSLSNARGRLRGCLACDWFEHTPAVFGKNFLAGGIWVNGVRQIQRRIACHTIEQIRHQCSAVFGREPVEHFSKRGHISVSSIIA